MAKMWPRTKDPQEVLDYQVEWTPDLGTDTIATSLFTVISGTVVIDSQTHTDTTATVWLSGGTLDETCELLNQITTTSTPPRHHEQTVELKIKAR